MAHDPSVSVASVMSATVSQVRSGSPGKGIDRVSNQPLKKSGAVKLRYQPAHTREVLRRQTDWSGNDFALSLTRVGANSSGAATSDLKCASACRDQFTA